MSKLLAEIDNLSLRHQMDLYSILESHVDPPTLTKDQETILQDRFERYEKGECKGIPWEEVKEELKIKYPRLNFDNAPYDPLSQELVEKVLKLSAREQIEIFEHLQPAADASFQQMLQRMNMSEEQWNQIHDEMYLHFSAKDKKEADEIRRRKGLI